MDTLKLPTPDEAMQFAVMLNAGLPPKDAIAYFTTSDDPAFVAGMLRKWQQSREVKRAAASLLGRPWHQMTTEERMRYAIDIHYSQLATYLVSHNYADLAPADKQKADSARQAIEAKLAGMAGKGDALSRFLEDLQSGKVHLHTPMKIPVV